MYIVLLGAPGSGKGTQGALLAERLGVPKVATGDLLRSAVKDGNPLGKRAGSYMTRGLLVPDEVVLGLIAEVLESAPAVGGMLMDGFPRTVAQAEAVDRLLETRCAQVDHVLLFDVPQPELVRRMLGRARKEGRSDDTPGAIEQRLVVYEQETAPLVAFYRERGIVREIPAAGPIQGIAARVWDALGT